MTDYGYPTTTNRSGGWFRRPEEEKKAAAVAARRADPNQHLDEVLRPIKERGMKSIGLLGLDTLRDKLADLVNHDPGEMKRLALAIKKAVDVSRMSHPHIIAADPKDHQISQAETKRRIGWCIEIAQIMRFDARPKHSLTLICERLPHWLDDWLEGTFWQNFKERRQTFARGVAPASIRRNQANEIG